MGPYKASLEWIGSVIPSQNTMERWAFLLMLVFVVVASSTQLVQSKEVTESAIDSYYTTVSPSHQQFPLFICIEFHRKNIVAQNLY